MSKSDQIKCKGCGEYWPCSVAKQPGIYTGIEHAKHHPATPMFKCRVEETDTFAGESNYNWVNTFIVSVKTDSKRAIVRAVNKRLKYRRMRTYNYGNMIEIRPMGICRVAFVTFTDDK